jgi:hypothetical protein
MAAVWKVIELIAEASAARTPGERSARLGGGQIDQHRGLLLDWNAAAHAIFG